MQFEIALRFTTSRSRFQSSGSSTLPLFLTAQTFQAFAGVRGVTDCHQILFRTGDVDVDLRIGGKPRVILGQILRRGAGHFLARVPVGLCQADRQIESTISDMLGEFRFGIAPVGKLRLHADLPEYRLIGDFTIKEEEIN